ncbi:MAG: 2-C-methyl-D-erythritol 4-phosphate cytidylyltransferase [Desulfobulbales bacterium]|nr:2-C-methyl-D-erythritol 4-phosphate cytidylyltransferase [Desulfobulbales bacterium]
MMNPSKVAAIIPAAGSGSRMGLSAPKQFLELQSTPILIHTLLVFQKVDAVGHIVVVVPGENCFNVAELVQEYKIDKVLKVVAGGKRRQDSVQAGLEVLPPEVELVLVHDGVRPFVPVSVIEECLIKAEEDGAAMVAVPVKDTLKAVSPDGEIEYTINRAGVWQAQTPQAARVALLRKAYAAAAEKKNFAATDEAALLELINVPIKVVEGSERNIKITRPEDLFLAKAILMESGGDKNTLDGSRDYRIGYGYDAHILIEGRQLVLGGETVPHSKGLLGHSDADVLTHALCDAMLGAISMGDIGQHFPDTDSKYKDISSLKILKVVSGLVEEFGYMLHNADITVVAEKPKLASYLEEMTINLADTIGTDPDNINLKATTTEGMGFEGKEEGISAHAVVLLKNRTS